MVDFTSSTLVPRFSLWVSREGNFPALLRPGPRIRGICLIRDSEARKASYFFAKKRINKMHQYIDSIQNIKLLDRTHLIANVLSKGNSPSFLTIFLFLLSFLRASMSMCGSSAALASSQCCWSPRMHTENLGRGVVFSLRGATEKTD